MDNPRVGNHLDVLRHPGGERAIESAMAPEPPHVNCRVTRISLVCKSPRIKEWETGITPATLNCVLLSPWTECAYNHRMPVFMCRWPNGDLSFVSARNKEDAIIALDELDNAELAELRQVRNFMVDFRLTERGDMELQGFGESCQEDIWNRAYPVLAKAMAETPRSAAGEATSAGKKSIRAAVHAEKGRLVGKKATKPAETDLGRSLQNQLGASSSLINRRVKEVATELLRRSPDSGRKQ